MRIELFFEELDASWRWDLEEKCRLDIIGSAALMLQTQYTRGTKDSDILETATLSGNTRQHLEELAGPGTDLHKRHRLYLDIVSSGLPFLPQAPRWQELSTLNAKLRLFHLRALDIVDVAVSKLKRFNANDVSDIDAMIEQGLIPHHKLIERYKAAVDWFEMDARAEELPRYTRNLHQVERDLFGLEEETEIDLPPWI